MAKSRQTKDGFDFALWRQGRRVRAQRAGLKTNTRVIMSKKDKARRRKFSEDDFME